MNEVEHAEAVRDLVTDAVAPWECFDFDDAPTGEDAPAMYVLMTLTRTVNGSTRMCGGRASREWRLDLTEVGSTVDEVRWLRDRISEALDDKRIAALGTSRLSVQSDSGIRPDDGLFSGITERTYDAPI